MKRNLLFAITLGTLLLGGNALAFGKEINLFQTTAGMTKKQTETNKKETKEKRAEAKKEAEQKRKEAKLTAKNSQNKSKKKHKKFLGIF